MDIQQQKVTFIFFLCCHDALTLINKNDLIRSCEKRPHLEPIQEESEQEDEDEAEKSRTSEEEDESFQIRAGAETEVTGAEESSEEEGDELRVMRLRRRLSSQSRESFPQMQFSSSEQAESENLSPPAWNSHTATSSDEGQQERPREEKRSTSRQLKIKVGFWHNFNLKVPYYTNLTLPVFSNNDL